MKRWLAFACVSAGLISVRTIAAQTVTSQVASELPDLVATYKQLHTAPELSHHEEKTAA